MKISELNLSKRTKMIGALTLLLGTSAAVSVAVDQKELADMYEDCFDLSYDRASKLATYINDMDGSETLARLLNLPIAAIESLAETEYLKHPY